MDSTIGFFKLSHAGRMAANELMSRQKSRVATNTSGEKSISPVGMKSSMLASVE